MKAGPGKVDIAIGAAVIIIGAVLIFVFFFTRHPGGAVIVSVDGKEAGRYSLSDSVDTVIRGHDGGTNHLIIRDGEVWLSEADCPDRLCVKQGRISHTGDSIICLPHRVSVRVVSDDTEDTEIPDAVVGDAGEVMSRE